MHGMEIKEQLISNNKLFNKQAPTLNINHNNNNNVIRSVN